MRYISSGSSSCHAQTASVFYTFLSDLNESIITGESKPVSKKAGDEVIAGSINGDGSLKVEIVKIGDKTFLAGVMRLVADAQVHAVAKPRD